MSAGAASVAGAVDAVEGLSALPSQPDLAAVCDIDVDAICGWQVWRALQAGVLVEAAQNAIYEVLFALVGVTSPLPVDAIPDFDAQWRAATAHQAAVLAGLTPPDRPGPERLVFLPESEPKGTLS